MYFHIKMKDGKDYERQIEEINVDENLIVIKNGLNLPLNEVSRIRVLTQEIKFIDSPEALEMKEKMQSIIDALECGEWVNTNSELRVEGTFDNGYYWRIRYGTISYGRGLSHIEIDCDYTKGNVPWQFAPGRGHGTTEEVIKFLKEAKAQPKL